MRKAIDGIRIAAAIGAAGSLLMLLGPIEAASMLGLAGAAAH